MDTPIAPLPIDERPPPRRRRLDPRLPLGLIVAGGIAIALWPAGGGEQSAPDAPVPAAPSTTVTPATTAPTTAGDDATIDERATDEPDDGFSFFAARNADAWVEPSAGLPPQATVVVRAEQPYLTRPEAGVGFCVAGVEDACTSVPTSDHAPGNEVNELTLVLPRTFTTWAGDRHDCVDDAPCEVRLWAQDGAVIELSVPVTFAPGEPIAPLAVSTSTTVDLGPDDVISVSLPADAMVVVLQCVEGIADACGSSDDYVQQPEGRAELDVTVERRIFTRRGPFDCAADRCELRFILADAQHADPIPLEFDPASDLGLPIVRVRPTAGLAHGTLVELRTPYERSGVAGYSICAPAEIVCAHLANRPASEELIVRLPRWIEDRVGARVVDCAVTACVIRTLIASEVIDTALTFAGTETLRLPSVVLARDTGELLRPGDELSIAARGLFVYSDQAVGRTGVDVRFCEAPDSPTSRCVNAVGDGTGLEADGSFATTVTIPNFDRRRSRVNFDGERAPFCSETCWVVVEPRLDVPGGAVEIDIQTPAEATG